jgi:orotate phosphoribosyltransferase
VRGGFASETSELLALLTEKSYAKKKVTLASGRESDFYIDCKKTVLLAQGHWLVGRALLQLIGEHAPECVGVGGLTMGADPLASAVSLMSYLALRPMHAFLVRKEPKGHGTGQWIEGLTAFQNRGQIYVAVVEDVITTGGSALKAIERCRSEGLTPKGLFAVVDRQEGGREAIVASGVPVHCLFKRSDFPA